MTTQRPVLVTGATGYIGGRLVPRLLEAGHRVRCVVRAPRKLEHRSWYAHPNVEIVECDLSDERRLRAVMNGCGAAYYLVHSMLSAGRRYADVDNQLARTFARAADSAALERIVYLGGLGETGPRLSDHLNSRREVEAALASATVPVTVFRAAMIIGAGSASFEILRYLVDRLPLMITPRWVRTKCQPIAVRDVLRYLTGCLDEPATIGQTLDIGGPDVASYADIIQLMAEIRGLPRRWIVPVPLLTPRLSSLWIHLVTPISKEIARPLAEGLRNEVVCRDSRAMELMPGPLFSVRAAISAALGKVDSDEVETRWSDAGAIPGDPDWAGGTVFEDPREIEIDASPTAVFDAVCRVGGGHGWYAGDWLWKLRGLMDKLVGGPGLRRGRRHSQRVAYGEALDFWRVTAVEPGRVLRLVAEMKLPGVATLEFLVEPLDGGRRARLAQTARFKPRGLMGLAYWYAVLPLHGFVFRGMMRGIRRAATSARPVATPQVVVEPAAPSRSDSQAVGPSV